MGVKKYIINYKNDISNVIELSKTKLIDSFIIYYGEEYRQLIIDRFNKIDFGWYINDRTIQNFNLIINKEVDNKFKESNQSMINLISAIYPKKNNFLFEILGITNPKFYNKDVLNKIPKIAYNQPAFKVTLNPHKNLICFNLCINDDDLIHEINHIIVESILTEYTDEKGKTHYILKSGIGSNDDSKSFNFEEVLNQRSAIEITKIFHEIGGTIFNNQYDFCPCFYNQLFPLIETFYEEYKELLKEVRITENKNLLFKYLKKDIFKKFENHISNMYIIVKSRFNKTNDKLLKPEEIELANELVRNMKKQPEKEIDMQDYLDELSKTMKTIKILNKKYLD